MKKILFIISLLFGILLIIFVPYLLFEVDNVVLYISVISLYTSSTTAIYSILAEPNPNKAKKQEMLGQLNKSILIIISRLEGKHYQDIHFALWKSIQKDDRYYLFDEEVREKLDAFLEKIKQYSITIHKLDGQIIPEIIDDSIVSVFNVELRSIGIVTITVIIQRKKGLQFQTSISEFGYYLKKKQSLNDIIMEKAQRNGIENENIKSTQLSIESSTYNLSDNEKITQFWNKCLEKMASIPEQRFVVKENEDLLRDAEEIKSELIKRIKKTINS